MMTFLSNVEPSFPRKRKCSGFTLVEMAVVMVIIGLIMLAVFPALNAVRVANQKALTDSNLRSLMLATAAFVQANGCLPCPAVPGGTNVNFGKVGTTTNLACGACGAAEGIAPFASLGIPSATARDGWWHWITMRADLSLTQNPSGIKPPMGNTGLCTQPYSTNGNGVNVTTVNGASQTVAVVFVSHGSMGYGSYVASPITHTEYMLPFAPHYAACGAGTGYAQCNSATMNSPNFYDSPAYSNGSDTYDDVLAYASRNALISTFGNASCGSGT